jgi:hypothetical protein
MQHCCVKKMSVFWGDLASEKSPQKNQPVLGIVPYCIPIGYPEIGAHMIAEFRGNRTRCQHPIPIANVEMF